ncbi:hypothetical protein ABPG75_004379 [Micractinium tetrahymenae]
MVELGLRKELKPPPSGKAALRAWLHRFEASSPCRLLQRASALCLCVRFVPEGDSQEGGPSLMAIGEAGRATMHLHAAFLKAAPPLTRLELQLPHGVAEDMEVLLPSSSRLRHLRLDFGHRSNAERELERCLQELTVRGLSDADPFDLGVVAAELPASLTALEIDATPEEADEENYLVGSGSLQQLSRVSTLQSLRLANVIIGDLSRIHMDQTIPPSLSSLTLLALRGHGGMTDCLNSSLAALPRLRYLSLEGTNLLVDGWPAGIEALTGLTFLSLAEGVLADGEQHGPPDVSALTRLVHLHVGSQQGDSWFDMPDLRPLGGGLRCLRCEDCEGGPLLQALPALARLTTLCLDSCPFGEPEPDEAADAPGIEIDLRHMTNLQLL